MYTLVDGYLFRYSFSRPLLHCLSEKEVPHVIEELHQGISDILHIGGRTLANYC